MAQSTRTPEPVLTLRLRSGLKALVRRGLNNELQEIQIPSVGNITISDYTWNCPATITYPGGTQRAYTYDALMRLQSLTVLDPNSNPILDYFYTYDNVGTIETKTTEHGNYIKNIVEKIRYLM